MAWPMKNDSKHDSPYRKRAPLAFVNAQKRPALYWVLLVLLIYIAFFAIVSQIVKHEMAQIENNTIRVYSQLSEQNQERTLAFFPRDEDSFSTKWPQILNPRSIFSALFSLREMRSESMKKLQHLILAFKKDLSEIDLSGLDLSGKEMDFTGANLSHANLTRVNFSHANLERANLTGANLTAAILTGANLTDALLSEADLSQADLSRGTFSNANFSGAILRETIIIDADLNGVNFLFADLSGVMLRESSLIGADLSGVTLYHADLISANLSRAHLGGATLDGTDLRYANLSRVIGLNQKQLDHSILDEKTILPEGFRRSNMAQ